VKVTGFSFIRNAVKFQYPVVEAIKSILPLCNEVVVAVGASDDGTRDLVASIDPKIRIIDTIWNDNLVEGGAVLAEETNKALKAIGDDSDWCFYIQGDEIVHEHGYDEIQKAMQRWKDDKRVDGLLFKYLHFYGSFDYIGTSSLWYRNEIRIIKNNRHIYSYRDAQGFRKGDNEKLKVKPLNAWVHHYGWVRPPDVMWAKQCNLGSYYDGQEALQHNPERVYSGQLDYSRIDALKKFTGTHPAIMQEKIKHVNWQFNYDVSYNKLKLKDRLKNFVEKVTGKRPFDFNNYKII
jgi:hypothetical protein